MKMRHLIVFHGLFRRRTLWDIRLNSDVKAVRVLTESHNTSENICRHYRLIYGAKCTGLSTAAATGIKIRRDMEV